MAYTDPERKLAADRARHKRNRAQKKSIINGFKSAGGCAVCGERDPVVLDCHHKDPATKSPHLRVRPGRQRVLHDLSFRQIGAELMKVEVLCANDHRRLTHSVR